MIVCIRMTGFGVYVTYRRHNQARHVYIDALIASILLLYSRSVFYQTEIWCNIDMPTIAEVPRTKQLSHANNATFHLSIPTIINEAPDGGTCRSMLPPSPALAEIKSHLRSSMQPSCSLSMAVLDHG